MPRPRRESDDVYNTRRRLKRQAAREAKAGNAQLAENLTRLANATYAQNFAGKYTYASATLSNIENIRRYQRKRDISIFEGVSRETPQRRARLNANASREERRKAQRARARDQKKRDRARRAAERAKREEQAALEAALEALKANAWSNNIPRRLSGWQRQALFASTAHIWTGKTYRQREESIMESLDVGSLEEAFAKMSQDINADQLANASAEEKYALTTAFARLGR